MGSLFLVLKAAPEQEEQAYFVSNLARAAHEKGHKVTVHAFGDGIFFLVPHMEIGPEGLEADMGKENFHFMYCNHNVIQRGLENKLFEEARKASTPDASMEFLNHDRTLIFTR